jgi:hypothetical protein
MKQSAMLFVYGLAGLALAVPAAAETITVNCEFGKATETTLAPDGTVYAARKERVDACKSDNPDFSGGKATVSEQVWGGDEGVYNLSIAAQTAGGDDLFFGVDGAWPAQTEGFSFEGDGPILGGTGKYKGAKGTVKHQGHTSDGVTGDYTVTSRSTDPSAVGHGVECALGLDGIRLQS